jgi:site-specific DNA recombinase
MIKDVATIKVDYVIVHKLDRWSRDRYDAVHYESVLNKHGTKLLSVTENLDDSPESLILKSVLQGINSYYSANLSREVHKGMRENALQCKHNGGKPALGFRVNPETKSYIIEESEAQIVRMIFKLYLDGLGYKQIIQTLNGNSVKTKWNGRFSNNSIYTILRNEKYCGTYTFNVVQGKDATGKRRDHLRKDDDQIIRIENGIPAIVSKETFQAVQAKLQKNKRASGAGKAKRTYLLSGLIFCGECLKAGKNIPYHGNSRYCGRKVTKYTTYRCSLKSRSKHECQNKEINADYIEPFIMSEIQRLLLSPDSAKKLVKKIHKYADVKKSERGEQTKEIKKTLNQVQTKIQRLITAITEGIEIPSIKEELENLEETKTDLEYRLHQIEFQREELDVKQVKKALKELEKSIKNNDIANCKKLLQVFVERVDVYLDRVDIQLKIDLSTKQRKQAKIQLLKEENTEVLQKYRHAA